MSASSIAPANQPVGPISVHSYRGPILVHHIVSLGPHVGALHLTTEDAATLAQLLTESIAAVAEGVHG